MHVTRMEAIHDLTGRGVQDRRRRAHRPFACQRPLIERQPARSRIRASTIQRRCVARSEVLAAIVSDVGLRRSQVRPISRSFEAAAFDGHDAAGYAGGAPLCEQPLNGSLGPFVLTLSELMLAHAS